MKQAAYESKWYDSNISHKNAVMMMQISSSYPTTVAALGFVSINIKTMATVILQLVKFEYVECLFRIDG